MKNEMFVEFSSISENESFARVVVASFVSKLDPTVDELVEIKTVVSEAVTNAIIHGYSEDPDRYITISCTIDGDQITLIISDDGSGIDNVEEKLQPMYTSKPELERSGMGFTIIENFMDNLEIDSRPGEGTKVLMTKQITTSKTASSQG